MSRHAFDELDLMVSPNNGLSIQYEGDSNQRLLDTDVRIKLEDTEGAKPYIFSESKGVGDTSNAKLSPTALARLIAYAIELKGPLRVGEVGHFLQIATGDNSILLYVKMQYKGLKNLISGFGYLFKLDTDHPYNPTVSLSEAYTDKMISLRALAESELSPFYTFESPVSSYVPRESESGVLGENEEKAQSIHREQTPPARGRTDSSESAGGIDDSSPDPQLQEEAVEWAHSIVAILEERGSMPVGEIGKCLQQYSGAGNELPQLIKAKFKGLKKLIEGFKLLFYIDQSHSLNPCVSLSAQYVTMKRTEGSNAEGLSSFFVFEPVKGYVPAHASNASESVLSAAATMPPMMYPASRNGTPAAKGSASKSAKKSKKTPPSQSAAHKAGGLALQFQQVQHGGARGAKQWVHPSYNAAGGSAAGYIPDSEYGYGYGPSASQPGSLGYSQQQQYYQTVDGSSFGGTWPAGSGQGDSGADGTGHIPSSWSEYKKTVTNSAPPTNIVQPAAASIPSSSTNGVRPAGTSTGSVFDSATDLLQRKSLPPRSPRRESFPLPTPSIRIDSSAQGMGAPLAYNGEYGFGRSPDDSMQMLAMSPNYMKYSNILDMLDIE